MFFLKSICSFLAQPNVISYLNLSNTDISLEPVCFFFIDFIWFWLINDWNRFSERYYVEAQLTCDTWIFPAICFRPKRAKNCRHRSSSISLRPWPCAPSSWLIVKLHQKLSSQYFNKKKKKIFFFFMNELKKIKK